MEATAATLERRVRVIPATRKPEELHRHHDGKMRVAAYCRVSTDSEEQLNSYGGSKRATTPRRSRTARTGRWQGSMPMEGISGNQLEKTDAVHKMITRPASRGHIDLTLPSPSPALPEIRWTAWIRCGS